MTNSVGPDLLASEEANWSGSTQFGKEGYFYMASAGQGYHYGSCIFSFLFQDKRYLLLPWIYMMILVVLYDTGSVALLTTVHLEREKVRSIWLKVFI